MHLTRFHGVLAPAASLRSRVVPLPPPDPAFNPPSEQLSLFDPLARAPRARTTTTANSNHPHPLAVWVAGGGDALTLEPAPPPSISTPSASDRCGRCPTRPPLAIGYPDSPPFPTLNVL